MLNVIQYLFPSRNQRILKSYGKIVQKINALEERFQALDDAALRSQTEHFKQRIAGGETLSDLLAEAFAAVREASVRTLGLRHFDVQLIGGMVLQNNKIAEMRTGEGKTLVATLPAYLNTLTGKGVHIVTVNDYLAQRDAEWMGEIYKFLGLSVGVIVSDQTGEERHNAYQADVTYGTNNEFGFDYLRDNMVLDTKYQAQRERNFAIIDEVDSILIDEARTPLIISGPIDDNPEIYANIGKLVEGLKQEITGNEEEEDDLGDYILDEKSKQVTLTEDGHQKIEDRLIKSGLLKADDSLYDLDNIGILHYVNAALRANTLFQKNVDYLVKNNEILIVDEFTGRAMTGRRWSDGLHQAIEAKEGVKIHSENQTLASITFQNYFRMYESLSGMTGTADTEAYEFQDIYGLETIVIPPHLTMVREDLGDCIYLTRDEKFAAIIEDIQECIVRQQPILVGTTSIEVSEYLSSHLKKENIKHQVLNAKQHETESHVIANAGRPSTVTIATNMAGRGTDIVLGGSLDHELKQVKGDEERIREITKEWESRHQQVVAAGGLHIIGTERHESRRIDNQLRGRSGRQGDPGSSRFYLSMEDNLMRIFAGDKVRLIMEKLGIKEGEAIEHPWVTRAIENAQRKVEAHNFDMRKTLLEYDDIANEQRKVVYKHRDELLNTDDIKDSITEIINEVMASVVETHMLSHPNEWDLKELELVLYREFALDCQIHQWQDNEDITQDVLIEEIIKQADVSYQMLETKMSEEQLRLIEKILMLRVLDHFWKEHLAAMDHLRRGIGLRGFAQKNPRQEYKRESYEMFEKMLSVIHHTIVNRLFGLKASNEAIVETQETREPISDKIKYQHDEAENVLNSSPENMAKQPPIKVGKGRKARQAARQRMQSQAPDIPAPVETVRRDIPKIGRNELCHCGSAKKYKHCCGKTV